MHCSPGPKQYGCCKEEAIVEPFYCSIKSAVFSRLKFKIQLGTSTNYNGPYQQQLVYFTVIKETLIQPVPANQLETMPTIKQIPLRITKIK